MRKELFWSWLAGFLDGEGSFGIQKQYPHKNRKNPRITYTGYLPILRVGNTDIGTLKFINSNLKVQRKISQNSNSKKNTKNRPCYMLFWSGDLAIEISKKILPYLVTKKRQGEIFSKWKLRDYSPSKIKKMEIYYQEIKKLNKRGV